MGRAQVTDDLVGQATNPPQGPAVREPWAVSEKRLDLSPRSLCSAQLLRCRESPGA